MLNIFMHHLLYYKGYQQALVGRVNPFKPNGISHYYQLHFKACWAVFFICIKFFIEHSVSKQWRPDQTRRSEASDLDLHRLPLSHKKDTRLIWVNSEKCYKGRKLLFKGYHEIMLFQNL